MARAYFLFAAFVVCSIMVVSSMIIKRSEMALGGDEMLQALDSEENSNSSPRDCHRDTPCSWSVYKPFIRVVEYRIINTDCKCAVGTKCRWYMEDTSMAVYVYKCRPVPTRATEPATTPTVTTSTGTTSAGALN